MIFRSIAIFLILSFPLLAKEKVYGFGEVDPVVREKKLVNLKGRSLSSAAYSLTLLGAAVPMGPIGIAFVAPLGIAGATAFVHLANIYEHPSTSEMGLNSLENGALELNTYGGGHSVIVTKDSAESFTWKRELVASAKHSIELSGSFCGGPTFYEILGIMQKKLEGNRDFQIHMMVTPDLLHPNDKDKLKELQETYPQNFHLLRAERLILTGQGIGTAENHIKLLIADEEYFVAGGSNLQEAMATSGEGGYEPGYEPKSSDRPFFDQLSGCNWRDMDMVGKGAAAKTLRLEFYKLWAKWCYISNPTDCLINLYFPIRANDAYSEKFETCPKKVDDVLLKIVPSSPLLADSEITKEYCALVDEAIYEKSDITIANMIFYPAKELLNKLKNAVNAGCKVTIISNNLGDNASFADYMFFNMNREGFLEIYKAARDSSNEHNLNIYEYHVADGMFHKKVWRMGEDISIFSSANLGLKSHFYDDELSIIVKSKEVAAQMDVILEKDKELSVKLDGKTIMSISSQIRGSIGTLLEEVM